MYARVYVLVNVLSHAHHHPQIIHGPTLLTHHIYFIAHVGYFIVIPILKQFCALNVNQALISLFITQLQHDTEIQIDIFKCLRVRDMSFG